MSLALKWPRAWFSAKTRQCPASHTWMMSESMGWRALWQPATKGTPNASLQKRLPYLLIQQPAAAPKKPIGSALVAPPMAARGPISITPPAQMPILMP